MNLKGLTVGLLSICGLWGIESLFSSSVTAQCIQADVSVQYNISGSQEPTDRTNDVDFQSHGSCRSCRRYRSGACLARRDGSRRSAGPD